MLDPEDFAKRLEALSAEDREHYKALIAVLVKCYSDDGPRAVITISHSYGVDETITINCDEMEAYQVAESTIEYLKFVNVKDAPPKEQFN